MSSILELNDFPANVLIRWLRLQPFLLSAGRRVVASAPFLTITMNSKLRFRLGLMMFLQYFVWGAWYVTLGTWLATTLKFSGEQIGWAAGTTAIGAIISPFVVGLSADRWFATQKLLGILHLIGAALLIATSLQSSFRGVYAGVLAYSLCY